jgi:hypothetical protein
MKHDRLPGAPILVENFGAVFGGDGSHDPDSFEWVAGKRDFELAAAYADNLAAFRPRADDRPVNRLTGRKSLVRFEYKNKMSPSRQRATTSCILFRRQCRSFGIALFAN